ncbi:MAG TPA: aldo/keto reductase [Bacilli bacterium]|jgi:hypothetical protein|nr:aldo/keto reductase [Acholeplasmataceae bacterium]HNZ78016.1 aldo/keto reductase [Bacilli bacterium]HOD61004.1 aldo/keto reductase [Bacilli bacterium]HOH60862.1 aldo/keto reductase [Bacilli bacterium]HPB48800.1 aldo/keto reductase [Bacilli bacterium]
MQYRKWYDKEIVTSTLGFGAMRLKVVDGEIDEAKGLALIDKAYQNGVNYFDTAVPYTDGKNETFVGKALKRYPRNSFYLATKLTIRLYKTKEELKKAIDKQLQNLQTDYIDFYLMHALNKNTFRTIKEWNIMEIVEGWKKEWKIRNIGFSFHDDYETFKEIVDYYPWDFCQIQLNYMDDEIQQGIQGYHDLVKKEIPVVIMEPVKGGKLASFNEKVASKLKKYNPEASLSSWAMRWVASLDGVKVILSGMNEMDQVEDNLNTFSNFKKLNEEEQKLIKEVKEDLKKITEVGCTNCEYCMPCTVGVNIPGNFRIFNDYAMYKAEGDSKWRYNDLISKKANASLCIECGKCVPQCPQGIDIPNELKRMLKVLPFLE